MITLTKNKISCRATSLYSIYIIYMWAFINPTDVISSENKKKELVVLSIKDCYD